MNMDLKEEHGSSIMVLQTTIHLVSRTNEYKVTAHKAKVSKEGSIMNRT